MQSVENFDWYITQVVGLSHHRIFIYKSCIALVAFKSFNKCVFISKCLLLLQLEQSLMYMFSSPNRALLFAALKKTNNVFISKSFIYFCIFEEH